MADELLSYKIVYDETREVLKSQVDQMKTINTKAGVLLGFTSLVVITIGKGWQPVWVNLIWLAPACLALCFGFIALNGRTIETRVEPIYLRMNHVVDEEVETYRVMIDTLIPFISENQKKIESSNIVLTTGFILFGLAVLAYCVVSVCVLGQQLTQR